MKPFIWLSLVVAAAAAVAADAVIKLAAILPFSFYGFIKADFNYTLRIAEAQMNALNFIPGATFQIDFLDNNRQAALAVQAALKAINGGYSGVIGDWNSDNSMLESYVLQTKGLFMCSGGSTNVDLGNKAKYPQFFRVIKPDINLTRAFLVFARSQGWTKVAVIAANTAYGQGVADNIALTAGSFGISVIARVNYDITDRAALPLKLNQIKQSGARIITLVPDDRGQADTILELADSFGMVGPEFVYIGPGALFQGAESASAIYRQRLQGSFISFPLEYTSYATDFINKFTAIYGRAPAAYSGLYYDCAMAMAYGMKHVAEQYNLNASQVAQNEWLSFAPNISVFTNFSFVGVTGPISFDQKGERVTAKYTLTNYQDGNMVTVATITGDEIEFSSTPKFFSGSSTVPADMAVLTEDTLGFNKPTPALIVAITTIMVVIITVTTFALIVHQHHPLLKPLSPTFMAVAAAGLVTTLCGIYISSMRIPTTASCNAYYTVTSVGFCMALGSTLVKLVRIYMIFDNTSNKRLSLSNKHLFMWSGLLVFINLVIVTIWAASFPLHAVERRDALQNRHYYECLSDNSRAGSTMSTTLTVYNGCLLIACSYFAFKTRDVYSAYNEAKSIGIAIYNIVFCGAIVLLIDQLASTTTVVAYCVRSVMVLFAAGVMYVLVIGRHVFDAMRTSGSELPSATTTKKGASVVTKIEPKGAMKSGTFPVKGKSTYTSSRWLSHTVTIVPAPLDVLFVVDVKDANKSVGIPLSMVVVTYDDDIFKVDWPKGSLSFQATSQQQASEWASAIVSAQKKTTRAQDTSNAGTSSAAQKKSEPA